MCVDGQALVLRATAAGDGGGNEGDQIDELIAQAAVAALSGASDEAAAAQRIVKELRGALAEGLPGVVLLRLLLAVADLPAVCKVCHNQCFPHIPTWRHTHAAGAHNSQDSCQAYRSVTWTVDQDAQSVLLQASFCTQYFPVGLPGGNDQQSGECNCSASGSAVYGEGACAAV